MAGCATQRPAVHLLRNARLQSPGARPFAGFAAFKNHQSYLPHSGSVLAALHPDLAGYEHTKGSLHFPIDQPLPPSLVTKLITTRPAELDSKPDPPGPPPGTPQQSASLVSDLQSQCDLVAGSLGCRRPGGGNRRLGLPRRTAAALPPDRPSSSRSAASHWTHRSRGYSHAWSYGFHLPDVPSEPVPTMTVLAYHKGHPA